MKQHYIDEKTGISYTLQGDYYLPDLVLPAEKENRSVGILGQRHLRYLKQHRKVFYTNLLTSGKLRSYTVTADTQFFFKYGFFNGTANQVIVCRIQIHIANGVFSVFVRLYMRAHRRAYGFVLRCRQQIFFPAA